MVAHQRLLELFEFLPESGVFIRKVTVNNFGAKAGDIAGSMQKTGYLATAIDGKKYLNHRLVFLYMTGCWPVGTVDHINRVRSDNRWENLRDVSQAINNLNKDAYGQSNSKHIYPNGKGWMLKYGNRYVGTFPDIASAERAKEWCH